MQSRLHCWCGNPNLIPFSPGYLRCLVCETLVAELLPTVDYHKIADDEADFYGRNYWFAHQEVDLGFSNITSRARTDLPERCLHWLRTLLAYKLPPGKILELGSAHGGFVALLRWAGFDATGLELSPAIVEYARQIFDVPMLLGPVEDQVLEPGSLDVIAFMDVLEHLPDPVRTMQHCLQLLKPDGILLLQTPCYPEGKVYHELLAAQDPFLEMLKTDEHLFLFSRQSVRELFQRLGASYFVFEPAMFAHYDMFLVVSRGPLTSSTSEAIEQSLAHSASGRMVQALLDADERRRMTEQKLLEAETDRAARLEVLQQQGEKLGILEGSRNELQAQVTALGAQITLIEADRAARLQVIEAQGQRLGLLEAECNELRGKLDIVRRTRIYKIMRRLGNWTWDDSS